MADKMKRRIKEIRDLYDGASDAEKREIDKAFLKTRSPEVQLEAARKELKELKRSLESMELAIASNARKLEVLQPVLRDKIIAMGEADKSKILAEIAKVERLINELQADAAIEDMLKED
jgi:hypothetical protein